MSHLADDAPISVQTTLYTDLFDVYHIQITLIAFSLNLIFKGNLSRENP